MNLDGRSTARTINQLSSTGTVNVRKTATEIATAIQGAIPNVGAITGFGGGNWDTGWVTGAPFALELTGTRKDILVRRGLDSDNTGHTLPSGDQHYTPWSRSLAAADLNNPYLNDFFGVNDGGDHKWNGLPYQKMNKKQLGIMDNFASARYGFMIFDSGSDGQGNSTGNNDFYRSGAQLLWNLGEGSTNNLYMQEMVSQTDLNNDGKIATCSSTSTTCTITDTTSPGRGEKTYISLLRATGSGNGPSGCTPLAGAIRDIVTYEYYHYFTAAQRPNENNQNAGSPTDTVPTMLNWWDWNHYGIVNANGHIVIDDPYFYFGCRKNNVIFLTDGGQTCGIPLTSYQSVTTTTVRDQVEATMGTYVHYLVNPSTIPSMWSNPNGWDSTKIYFLGFGLGANPTGADTWAPHMLNYMAAASDLPGDTGDRTTPLMANNEDELNSAFTWIMNKIMEGTFTRSTPAVNTNLTAAVAGYFDVVAGDYLWRGHLIYVDFVSESALAEGSTTLNATVDAATLLHDRTSAREIFTSRYVSSAWSKLDFTTANNATLQSLLFTSWPVAPSGYLASGNTLTSTDVNNLINFVRCENSPTFGDTAATPREWKLGAIYHSTPVSMGPPPKDALPSVARYQAFADNYSTAPEMVYVGALDGMLHAFFFKDPDGAGARSVLDEGFSYIPNFLLSSLYPLRKGHQQIYVDGDPNVGVEYVTSTGTNAWCDTAVHRCWQTILYGGMRDGGPAYYSLNITDISTTAGSVSTNVQPRWEFTDPKDPTHPRKHRLGASWSLPFVDEALFQPAYAGTLDSRLILVFGGGKATNLDAYEGSWLYILDADEGKILRTLLVPDVSQTCSVTGQSSGGTSDLLLAGSTASGYFQMLDCDSVADNNHNQVPGDVLIKDIDLDEFPDWIYFGDLQGRMWKANIHDKDPAKWGLCLFFDTGDRGYDDLTDISTECNGDLRDYGATQPTCVDASKRRPIFYRPVIAQAPDGNSFIVYFGTGHIEDTAEAGDTTHINYIFAVKDSDAVDECTYGEIWGGSVDLNSNTSGAAIGGFPIKLDPGEKIISAPQIVLPNRFTSEVSFQTYKPFEGSDVCKPGVTYKWQVDYSSGAGALCTLATCTATGWARNQASPGLAGRSLVLGDIMFTPTLPTSTSGMGGGEFQRNPTDLLNGFYYWWIK